MGNHYVDYEIISRIKEEMKKQNLTQSELSKKAKLSSGALSNYFAHRYIPKYTTLRKIAEALDISIDSLLGINEKSNKEIDKLIATIKEYNLTETEIENLIEIVETNNA